MANTVSALDSNYLPRLNSLTKYPSIPNFHSLDSKGGVIEEDYLYLDNYDFYVTEKVDGTNARVILDSAATFVGSREELLHCVGDVVFNSSLNIVPTLMPFLDQFKAPKGYEGYYVVFYLEVYGGRSQQGRQYTSKGDMAARLISVQFIEVHGNSMSQEEAARWRDNKSYEGREWWPRPDLYLLAPEGIEVVPDLGVINGGDVPQNIDGVIDFLDRMVGDTQCALDDTTSRAEGVVLHSMDGNDRVKVRYQDYERTLRRRNK